MKINFLALFLLSSFPANAHDFQQGYTSQRTCYKEIYKEEYVPGSRTSKGYVRSFFDKVVVPCGQTAKVHHHHYRHSPTNYSSRTRYYRPTNNYSISKNSTSTQSCRSSTTTGGLLGGGIAAALSKKDAYGWSIPLGAVIGMGIGGADC